MKNPLGIGQEGLCAAVFPPPNILRKQLTLSRSKIAHDIPFPKYPNPWGSKYNLGNSHSLLYQQVSKMLQSENEQLIKPT
jgi:hypothetical protein